MSETSPPNVGCIVVGADGSPSSLEAMRWARYLSRLTGIPVRAVLVVQILPTVPDTYFYGGELPQGVAEGFGDRLDEIIEQAYGDDLPDGLQRRVVNGVPAQGLMSAGEDADLIVVGSRGLGGFRELMLGSVSAALAAHASCPVLVVRGSPGPGGPSALSRIVVGVDGSPAADAALRWGLRLAEAADGQVEAIATWQHATDWLPVVMTGELPPSWNPETVAGELLDHAITRVFGTPPARVKAHTEEGAPTPTLLRHAESADLLVLGSRGRGGFAGLLLGSVSGGCVRHSPCPVLVVRPEPAETDTAATGGR